MIRSANRADAAAVWAVIEPVIRSAETYAIDSDLSRQQALDYWFDSAHRCFVAEIDGQVVGTYYLRQNNGGGGSHVCNCGFMVAPEARGRGVARAMGVHALATGKQRGFLAMQFNFVVATNTAAVGLWTSLGFDTVGRVPDAFRHPHLGLVEALVMHRKL